MSMNLHCEEVELYQTPTFITYLCYYSNLLERTKGDDKDIAEKYILWLNSYGNRTQDWEDIDEQIKQLRQAKKLTFSIV